MRVRITTRRLMVAVFAAAVLLRLGFVAARMAREPNAQTISHLRRHRDGGDPFVFSHGTTPCLWWAEYWRRALGLAWPGGYVCRCKAEQEAEMGKATIDVDSSHDMDAMDRRMNEM